MIGPSPTLEAEMRRACLDLGDECVEEELGRGLVRGLLVRPEFSCREGCAHGSPNCRPGSGGYHGVGARRILWYVRLDGTGGVGFDFYTSIYTDDVLVASRGWGWTPLGSVDIHLAAPPSEPDWMTEAPGDCVVAGGKRGRCWCDGTTLGAEHGAALFLEGGSPAVWSWLAEDWLPHAIERASQ